MSRVALLLLLLIAAIGLGLRCVQLDTRPMHNDEGVNAYKVGQLWPAGSYKYDFNEHHGPTLIYATYAYLGLTGASRNIDEVTDSRLRTVTVLFGLGLLLLLPLTVDALGRRGTLWAALFTAVSPAMVFYSRYYIHESLLVFFAFLAIAAGWRYWKSRKIGWILLAAASLGLMHATKETFVLSVGASVAAAGLNQAWNRWVDATGLPVRAPALNRRHLIAGLAVWLLVALALFSSFFTNAAGPWDSVRTYFPWLHRAGGESPHIHEWSYYWKHLLWFHPARGPVWTEASLLVLAGIAFAAGFMRRRLDGANASFVRFLSIYTLLLAFGYSSIPYKTPWCLLNFWHGVVILAGVGAAVLLRCVRLRLLRAGAMALVLAGAAHLAWEAWQLNIPLATDRRNPYIYSQTLPNILLLVDKMKLLAKASPQGPDTLVKVMAPGGDFWPLPWYLRQFRTSGWYEDLPSDPYAPLMVVSARFRAGLDENKTHLMVGYFQMRPDVFFELYVEKGLWENYLKLFPPALEE